MAISQNGKMLAIGARKENSASEDKSATDSIQDSGAVYIFSDSDENGWQETHFVKAEVIDIEDNFGANLALSHNGKTLAVAIPGDDATGTGVSANPSNNSENASDSGAVVVFELNDNNTWEQVAFLKASKVQADLGFGQALAISGDGLVLAVGGIFSDTVETFIKTNQGWRTFDTVKIAGASDSERFGHSLSLNTEGNVLAVSAPGVFGSDSSDIGKIYILTKGVDAFNSAKLIPTPAELTVKAQFGISIDLSADGTTLAAGSDAGAAYIFQLTSSSLRNENIWQLKHKITHSDKSAVKFGRSVSLNDDGSLISIYQESANLPAGISNQRPDGVANRFGALSVYRLGEKSVKLLYGLSPLKLAVYLEFGLVQMLSGDGKTLVASSASEGSNATGVNNEASHDRGDFSNSGAAWVFHL